MIRIQGRGAIYGELWFEEEPEPGTAVDILYYRKRRAPPTEARSTPFLSLVSDLSGGAEAIAGRFGKDCRYKIRRADTKDGLRFELNLQPAGKLEEFAAFYDEFAQQKSMPGCDLQWLGAACYAGQLVLASVEREGETLVRHAYLVSGHTAWLQYSASRFRDRESDYRNLVGRANRWLHWQAMLGFRDLGTERYDWGGLFQDESTPERAGINRFKREFGGDEVRSYDCTVAVSLRGRLYLPLRNAWRRHAGKGRLTG